MKKILLLGIVVAFYSCSSNSKSDSGSTDTSSVVVRKPDADVKKPETKPDTTAKDTTAKTQTAATSASGKWTYKEETDKMTSKTNYYASIDANELVNLPFPYDGGQTATLLIRNQGGRSEAMLSITKGQFISHVGENGTIKIRFDQDQPTTFSTGEPSDGSSDVLFINNATKLLKKLKTAKKIIIQAEFYDAGLKTMEFDTDGFTWNH